MSLPRRATGHRAALLVSCVAVALAGCTTPGEDPAGPPGATADAGVDTVVSGLDVPWSVVFHDDTALVSERESGRVVELADDGGPREVGVVDEVTPGAEGGLLGLAVHEDRLYAYFTAGAENRIERYDLVGGPGSLGLGASETVLDGIPSARNHNGGRIAFGPDGMLYATAGDAGDPASAQDRGSLAGKILRLTPDGEVPDDNPFDGSPVYSSGHRNPQGIAWDEDGTMYASEFGQDTWDELNVIEPGADYGWPEVEGVAGDDRFVDPVQQWRPAEASPSGIAVADGSIWIANLRGERLREVPLDDLSASTEHLVGQHGRLRDATAAPDGFLWVLTNNTDGRGDPAPDDDRILRLGPLP
ncbi:PQQ-dependent sugar dehydrogenase [Isoptericola halotolerans]|uniref:PQQ-dependent sugar dehydrogenase n=1 Tax=Isoptericola halotolerans TaxID=300560 RepID=UPI0038903DE0